MSKERLTEKTKDCFGYRLKDGSDAEVGFFKDYDAFYSHMMTVKALGEYEDLEEQGLLLRLPCKARDTVWRIVPKTYKHIQPLIIESFIFDGKELLVKDNFGLVRSCETFGKTIFFTEKEAQSEAEEKLRELEGK